VLCDHRKRVKDFFLRESHRSTLRLIELLASLVRPPVFLQDESCPFSSLSLLLVKSVQEFPLLSHLFVKLCLDSLLLPLFIKCELFPALCDEPSSSVLGLRPLLIAKQIVLFEEFLPLSTQFLHSFPSYEATPSFLDVSSHDDFAERADLVVKASFDGAKELQVNLVECFQVFHGNGTTQNLLKLFIKFSFRRSLHLKSHSHLPELQFLPIAILLYSNRILVHLVEQLISCQQLLPMILLQVTLLDLQTALRIR